MRDALANRGVTVLRRLEGGHRNTVWLVEKDGARLVAKTTGHGEDSLRWLLPVLAAARSSGLDPPPLIPDSSGRLAPGGMTLEPFVTEVPPGPGVFQSLAPRLRAFHARLRRHPERPGGPPPSAPRAHVARLSRAMGRLGPARTVVHGDVTLTNLLMTSDGPVLLDWDEARRDHPAFDLPLAAPPDVVREARQSREVVHGWGPEPDYARRLARQRTVAF